MPTSHLLAAIAALALGGCFLGIGDCSYEHRTLELAGTLVSAAPGGPASAVDAMVSLNETRNSNPDFRVLNIQLTGALAGSVTAAELRDVTSTPATVLAKWTQGSAQAQLWDSNIDLTTPSPAHEELASLARAGRLRLMVSVGPSGSEGTLDGRLGVTNDGSWNHPRCD